MIDPHLVLLKIQTQVLDSTKFVLKERERELLELKGPCSSEECRLHYAHYGPCDINNNNNNN